MLRHKHFRHRDKSSVIRGTLSFIVVSVIVVEQTIFISWFERAENFSIDFVTKVADNTPVTFLMDLSDHDDHGDIAKNPPLTDGFHRLTKRVKRNMTSTQERSPVFSRR